MARGMDLPGGILFLFLFYFILYLSKLRTEKVYKNKNKNKRKYVGKGEETATTATADDQWYQSSLPHRNLVRSLWWREDQFVEWVDGHVS